MKFRSVIFILIWVPLLVFGQKPITVEDIWQTYSFYESQVPGFNFQDDGEHYTRLEQNKINAYSIANGKLTSTLFDAAQFTQDDERGFTGEVSSYEFSNDEHFILIKSASEAIYRRSSKAQFFIYNRERKTLTKLYQGPKQMYAMVSPDGQRVAFVVDNNLFVRDLQQPQAEQITHDGVMNQIINGATDWVYEEEFSMNRAFEWSLDGQSLAFLRFDESLVPEYTMMNYVDKLYPEYTTFKYPKVGENNAKVSVHIFDISTKMSTQVDLPKEELYIPRIQWTGSKRQLCVTTFNRHQNHLRLFLADASTGKTNLLLEEKSKYYVDLHDNLQFLKNGKEYIWTSEKNGYNHVYLHKIKGGKSINLTPGAFDVTAFYGYDEANGDIYYQAADESPLRRNVYRSTIKGNEKKKLNSLDGWNSVQLSATMDYYVLNHSTSNQPPTYRVYNRKGEAVRDLELNEGVKKKQEETQVSLVEFFNFQTEGHVSLNGYMIKPLDFDPAKEYPVFMYLYGGPNSQQAVDSWGGQNYWWFQMLAQQGYIVACVDNRGTGARGEEFRKMTYLQLGHYETIDQIEAARYLSGLPFVDETRIGIFGWSYGGYMSSLCLFKGNEEFKMAIAVAPVANWRWYDTIYTERFMRTEKENEKGYRDNSPVYFADKLKGKYLLVHGGADDNVHIQNSMEMSAALIRANKQFDVYFYPNNNHGIYNGNARLHLYTKMTNFIKENL